MTWRKLESTMCDVLREFGYHLDRDPRTGDCFIIGTSNNTTRIAKGDFNITSFAQEIVGRIKRYDKA